VVQWHGKCGNKGKEKGAGGSGRSLRWRMRWCEEAGGEDVGLGAPPVCCVAFPEMPCACAEDGGEGDAVRLAPLTESVAPLVHGIFHSNSCHYR
jgi:hypothetical protein